MNRQPGWIAVFLLLVMAAVTFPACGAADGAETAAAEGAESTKGEQTAGKDEDEDDEKEEAVPVEVAALDEGEIEAVLSFSSSLEVESQVKVRSQARRQVRELLVEEGDTVKREQLLLRLQDEEQRSAVAKVETELTKSRKEYDRSKRLHEQQLISDEAFANANFEFERLQITLEDMRRELGYTEVRAPISGTIAQRMDNLGDHV